MLLILGCVIAGGVLVWPRVEPVFLSSPYLNGTIGVVFVIGVFACFWQVFQLFSSVAWIEQVAGAGAQDEVEKPPQLLAAATGIVRLRGARMQITPATSKSILDSVGARMEESRDITRYIANLLIFLGLLGTFFGLATTVPAVVETIRSLQPTEGEEGLAVFGRLMDGLEDQLGGMGTAFASSLLGLAGSLVVGLLELFAGHGQNRFYREMEEWLASITRVSFSSGEGEGGVDRGAIATVLDHMVDQVETLQSLYSQSEARRAETDARLADLANRLGAFTELMGSGQIEAAGRLATAQERLAEVIESQASTEHGLDEESRMRLRSIDVQLFQIFEELGEGRALDVSLLREDIAGLTDALRSLTQAARAPMAARRPAPRSAPPSPAGDTPDAGG
ncbi:MotA/TolQ/ExbB proton channel family protein, probably associated with flagella [Roseibacterium elongatum DSM 19469]|uniref:MotA/TolQ/ExbB proton channel family protein, probably associated with flagella n=2 Tax=Roseicyclus elongatus TaxID=159346 RepID=W8RSW2_9RHOB|nr:MotA/TolQ/ExbB proton channel family protein, probably associated with flagella [Roseibacterium elongatum DSM 19469]